MDSFSFKKHQKVYFLLKRIIDIFGSLIGILIFAPLFWWWIAIVIKCTSPGPVFFRQERVGLHKKTFVMIKFRSMHANAPEIAPSEMTEEQQKAMEYKFGNFLRKSSLDETAQLINILKGDMSFIGPRPGAAHNEEELIRLRESYTPSAFDVKPGLSGYAQVKMNREHDPAEKAKYDHEYAEKVSLWLDIKIFFMTVFKVFGLLKGR